VNRQEENWGMEHVIFDGRIKSKIKRFINGINLIDTFKKDVEKNLVKKIDKEKVNAILNNDKDLDILTKDEAIHLFKCLYNFTKDEELNPIILFDDNSNENYSDLLYNKHFKEKFLKEKYSQETARVKRVLFGKISKLERFYGKDIYDFNIEELEEVWKFLKASTIRSLQNHISTIEQYIDYAIQNHKTRYKVNLATTFDKRERIEPFLDKEAAENMIFTKEEIDAISMYADNAQDGAIIALIFEGVSYKNRFEELINLKRENIDLENQEIHLPQRIIKGRNGEEDIIIPERTIKISTNTAILVKNAMNDEFYYSIKGDTVRRYKLTDSEYVLRGTRGNKQIRWENINQRILRIAEINGYDYLTARTIAYSGQLYYAKQLLDQGMNIDDVVQKIIYRYGINNNTSSQFYLKNRINKYLNMDKQ